MISPQAANVLKPLEVTWLQESEAYLDKKLMAEFTGEVLELSLKVPPFPRTLHVLMDRYKDWNWAHISSTTHLIRIRIAPKGPLTRPIFSPQDQVADTAAVIEQAQTAWERIENSD